MTQFEWRTDEEDNWEEELAPAPQLEKRGQPRWWVWLGLLGVIVTAVFLSYQRANQRIEEVSATVMADIQSSLALRQRALTEGDAELYDSVLSGSDVGWTMMQQQLFLKNLAVSRWPLGWHAQAETATILDIQTAPDLKAAEVTVAQQYVITRTDGVEEVVTFQRTDVYRLGRVRWLYSPPDDEFWGEWLSADGRYLTLVYPQRDQALAERLLPDLDAQLAQLCTGVSECGSLHVRLSDEPDSLLMLANLPQLWRRSAISLLDLPAPSLVGIPTDEAGYQALLRGYAAQVVTTAVLQQLGWQCCEQGLLMQALIDKQLQQLDLKPWPLTADHYATLFKSPIRGVDQLHPYWLEPPILPLSGDSWREIYSVVDFVLHKKPKTSITTMMTRLTTAERYSDWLYTFTPPIVSNNYLQQEWLRFAQAQLSQATADLPDQDITLLCRPLNQRTQLTTIFRYHPDTDEITADLPGRNFLFMNALPTDDGLLLHERQVQFNRTQVILWRDGQETVAAEQPLSVGIFYMDDVGSDVTLYSYDFVQGEGQQNLLALGACVENGCPATALRGTPYWSPNGRYVLLHQQEDNQLWLADQFGQYVQDLGLGTTPFWLDNEHYGYARVAGNLASQPAEIVVAALADRQLYTWLPLAELASALPAQLHLNNLAIRAVTAAPNDPNLLFIAVSVRSRFREIRTLLFSYDKAAAQIELLYETPFTLGFYRPLTFSPDGRWLVTTTFAHTNTLSELFLYDMFTGKTQLLGSNHLFSALEYDWAADSQWLLRLEDGFLHLMSPLDGTQRVVIHELPGCAYAAWVNR
jgi:hypothetical protein